MDIGKRLYEEAVNLINKRYPTGYGGAAAMYTSSGKILTSVAPETINSSTELCIETGAILEAHKLNENITHTICVVRENEHSDFMILTPCGICQERLFYWGSNVKAAVSNADNSITFKTLEEIQPHYWRKVYKK
ncbi:blasticidin S deaminase, putative [Candidatus Syntrophocurvum alkaliphilum]|uniref:Blasticidin S deaminase, putative n=1 Tax=Candidatus Syntrophocurvum alkaliphilum TaxID=2293317 RepID=A0A6I6DL92_9FIRM|nr:cytidine deaminase [Candidatus Syntrophocurvum alkaliphilum]QGU00620.1 blasticidin S deaminase, putative [Candidatus Syntrophocurvum alkaliphilum]